MDGEGLWELRTRGLLPGGLSRLRGLLQFAVLLRVTVLNVLQQVGLLHVEEWTLRAGKDLGGHLHSGTLFSKVLEAFMVLQERPQVIGTGECLQAVPQYRGGRGQP